MCLFYVFFFYHYCRLLSYFVCLIFILSIGLQPFKRQYHLLVIFITVNLCSYRHTLAAHLTCEGVSEWMNTIGRLDVFQIHMLSPCSCLCLVFKYLLHARAIEKIHRCYS